MREFHHMISSVPRSKDPFKWQNCGLLWQSCWMPTSGICQSWRPLTYIIFADLVIFWNLGYWCWSQSRRFSRPAICPAFKKISLVSSFLCIFSCVRVLARSFAFFCLNGVAYVKYLFGWRTARFFLSHPTSLPGIRLLHVFKSHPCQDPIAHREWCLKHSSQEKGTNNRECLPNATPNSAGPPLFALWNGLVLKVSTHNLTSQHGHSEHCSTFFDLPFPSVHLPIHLHHPIH